VISTLLKNIVNKEQEYKANGLTGLNCQFKAKLAVKEWGPLGKGEDIVVIRDNEHLKGALDKASFGASDYGLVHAFHEVYGSEKAGELLTSLARVFAVYLQTHGFTCGLDDLVVDKENNKRRRFAIEDGHAEGMKAAAEFCGIKNYVPEKMNFSGRVVKQSKTHFDDDFEALSKCKKVIQENHPIREGLDKKISNAPAADKEMMDAELDSIMQGAMNDATSKVLKQIIPEGLVKRFPKNNLSAMVMTGAKGGVVNQTQISALLGQQSLEGRRVPKMQNGKTLPCYLPYDPNPRSSGYVSDRFISGLRPQEFYFHCMAGREGLIDTAVKTSRSGYLQRCLIKQLESLIVNYDMTVRDNDGSVVQFLYGEDAIDVINTKYYDKFEFLE
jgi:DNA-directed RNA polymerase I subunit RPA1